MRDYEIAKGKIPLSQRRMFLDDGSIATEISPGAIGHKIAYDRQSGIGIVEASAPGSHGASSSSRSKQGKPLSTDTVAAYLGGGFLPKRPSVFVKKPAGLEFIPIRWESVLSNPNILYGPDRTWTYGSEAGTPVHHFNEGSFPYGKFGLNLTCQLTQRGSNNFLVTTYDTPHREVYCRPMSHPVLETPPFRHPAITDVLQLMNEARKENQSLPSWVTASFFDIHREEDCFSGNMVLVKEKNNPALYDGEQPDFSIFLGGDGWAHDFDPEIREWGYRWDEDFGFQQGGDLAGEYIPISNYIIHRFDDERGQIIQFELVVDLEPANGNITGAVIDIIIPANIKFTAKLIPSRQNHELFGIHADMDVERHLEGIELGQSSDRFQHCAVFYDQFPFHGATSYFYWVVEFYFE